MKDFRISSSEVLCKLNALKVDKSPGPDLIHPKVLYELRYELCEPLAVLFNCSLKLGFIPDMWKSSIVKVIFKKGAKDSISNYRPISLTCIVCKILESIIRDRLMEYMKQNSLFSDYQFGFIKGRSIALQLLGIVDEWTRVLDEHGQVDVIYTDFEKAFDKVPHKRLLSKLYSYGINESIINW